jgi:hypothetical protein
MALLAACGGGGQPAAATPVPPTEAPQATATTPPPTAAPTTEAAAEPTTSGESSATETPGEETTEEEPAVETATRNIFEIADINSYRSRTTITLEGPALENEEFKSLEILGEHVKEPPAQRVTMQMGEGQNLEMVLIGNQSWMNVNGQWISTSGQETPDITEDLSPFDLSAVEDDLAKMERVGKERVNGMDTTHYRFDKAILLNLLENEVDREDVERVETVEGHFYVADKGFIVKWTIHLAGTGLNPDDPEAEGRMTMETELYDFNAPIEITPPETPSASDSLGFELPEPEGAVQQFATNNLVSYSVPGMSLEELVDFYTDGLEAAGFEYDEAGSMVSDDFAILSFTGDKTVNVTIEATSDEPNVTIMVMEE